MHTSLHCYSEIRKAIVAGPNAFLFMFEKWAPHDYRVVKLNPNSNSSLIVPSSTMSQLTPKKHTKSQSAYVCINYVLQWIQATGINSVQKAPKKLGISRIFFCDSIFHKY